MYLVNNTLYHNLSPASQPIKPSHTSKLVLLASIIPALMFNAPALADTNDNAEPEVTLDAMTVTATRLPTRVQNTIAQSRVINSEELQSLKGQSAFDIIKRLPGFSFYSNGGVGTAGNFYIRGYDSKSVLVLIDGIRYSSISLGTPTLNLLPAEQIDRIELLYGASGTSIYGADAVGGVIQIFTKGVDVDESNISVTAGAGSHNQFLYGATAQLANKNGTSLSLSASHNETDGINAILPEPNNPYSRYNPDDDGYESDNYSLRLSHSINDNLTVGISGLYSESTTEFDNGVSVGKDQTKSEQKNGAAQTFVNWQYLPNSSVKLTYGESIDESFNPTFNSNYDTKQKQLSLIGTHATPIGNIIYGFERLNQSLDTNQYSADDREVTSGFAGYQVTQNNFDGQINVRHDDYSDFDSETTYNVGAAYRINPNLRIGANYAKGYRVPTFNDLYYPGSENPDLTPETSDNYEAFLQYDTLDQSTRLTGYYNKAADLLAFISEFDSSGNWIGGRTQNVNKAKTKGVTLTSDWFVNNYLFGLSYDYQKATDESEGYNDGNYLPIRPEHKGLVYIGYQLPSLDVRAEYEYVDDYFYNIANTQKVDSYGLVNISGNYKLNQNLSMSARLNNVTNKKYVTAPGYNTDGTNFFTSLTYTWK